MKARSIYSLLVSSAVVLATPVAAQEQDSGASGRLPPYFKDVVNAEQKATIYKIQSQYDDKLAELEKQFDDLSAQLKRVRENIDAIRFEERDAIEKVLSAKQLAQVKRAQAEAQAKLAQQLLKAAEEAAKRAEALAQPE